MLHLELERAMLKLDIAILKNRRAIKAMDIYTTYSLPRCQSLEFFASSAGRKNVGYLREIVPFPFSFVLCIRALFSTQRLLKAPTP